MRILLADDEPDIQLIARVALEDAGWEVHVAGDGLYALECARTELFDLVLLDAVMPHLDGFDTCRLLKSDERTRQTPVIFFSAKTQAAEMQRALGEGAAGYILKPFNIRTLADEIRTLLAAQPQ